MRSKYEKTVVSQTNHIEQSDCESGAFRSIVCGGERGGKGEQGRVAERQGEADTDTLLV